MHIVHIYNMLAGIRCQNKTKNQKIVLNEIMVINLLRITHNIYYIMREMLLLKNLITSNKSAMIFFKCA
jgi:hypothetical protein